MRSVVHVSALLLAVGACIGIVTAKHIGAQQNIAAEPTANSTGLLADDFDEVTGSIALSAMPRLALTDEQRGFIFFGVINLPDVPDVPMRTPLYAEQVPQTLELHDIPAMVIRRIPHVRDYKFVKLEDRILLVDAETRRIEAMIPRYKLVVH